MHSVARGPAGPDPLFPGAALLPMTDPGGVQKAVPTARGRVRPFSATLGVPPVVAGKHNTSATRWTEQQQTQTSKDGVVVPDTTTVTHTDT
jgi:hypothetical protein